LGISSPLLSTLAEEGEVGERIFHVNFGAFFLSLIVVLSLVGLLYWFFRRTLMPLGSRDKKVRVHLIPLTYRHHIAILTYKGREFLLGLSEGRIQLLGEFSADESEEFAQEVEKWLQKEELSRQ
jgi:flagellar biogenesis protein FliO